MDSLIKKSTVSEEGLSSTEEASTAAEKPSPINLMEFHLYRVSYEMYPITLSTLFVLGSVGNILSVVVLSRKKMRVANATICLCALAVSDFLVVLAYFISIVQKYYVWDIISPWFCKILIWAESTFQMISSYLIILMTAERFLAVTFPLKVAELFTKKVAIASSIAVYIALIFLNIPYMIFITGDPRRCTVDASKFEFFAKWSKFDSTIALYVPGCSILILNTMIIIQLRRASKRKKDLQQGQREGGQTQQITRMLLAVSIMYWILNAPMGVYTTGVEIFFDLSVVEEYIKGYLTQNICVSLMLLNNCINFYLYCMTGKKFRQELQAAICCCPRRKSSPSTSSASRQESKPTSASQISVTVQQ